MPKFSPNAPCPCGSNNKYKKCCRPYHQGKQPQTPEQLMRSRYTAYVLGKIDYVMATTHPDSLHKQSDTQAWRRELTHFVMTTRFQGLQIVSTKTEPPHGWVTFKALLEQQNQDASFVEQSLFEQLDGRWLYKSAVTHT